MIRKLSENIAYIFVKNGIAGEDEHDIYRYGVEVILCDIVDVIVVLISGIIFRKMTEALWYYVNFLVLRSATDGYHAKTFLACKLCMAIMMIAVLFIESLSVMTWCYVVISVVFIIVLESNISFKWNKAVFTTGYMVVECILMKLNSNLAMLTMEANIIVLIASNIKRKGVQSYDKTWKKS